MSAQIIKLIPKTSAAEISDIDTLITLALFCGTGLLLSICVIVLDQYTPGEWF